MEAHADVQWRGPPSRLTSHTGTISGTKAMGRGHTHTQRQISDAEMNLTLDARWVNNQSHSTGPNQLAFLWTKYFATLSNFFNLQSYKITQSQ